MRKKRNGYSLVEIIMVLGVISMLTIAVYNVAAKTNINYKVDKQAQLIQEIITGLEDHLVTVSDADTSSTATISSIVSPIDNLITQRLIPNDMIVDNGGTLEVKTLFGTAVNIGATNVSDGVNPAISGYYISMDKIPNEACSRLASHPKIVEKSQNITVNGVSVKAAGSSQIDPAALSNNCVSATDENTISVSVTPFKNGVVALTSSNALSSKREKESPGMIAPIGEKTTPGVTYACTGGAIWDLNVSSCVCSTGVWNGVACSTSANTVNNAGNCGLGMFWEEYSRQCVAISTCSNSQTWDPISRSCVSETTCGANQSYDRIRKVCVADALPNSAATTLCIPGVDPTNPNACVSGIVNKYATTTTSGAGRQIPATVTSPISKIDPTNHTLPTNTTMTTQVLAAAPAQSNVNVNNTVNSSGANVYTFNVNPNNGCPAGARPFFASASKNSAGTYNAPVGKYDNMVCQMCINGSWNGDRCVSDIPE